LYRLVAIASFFDQQGITIDKLRLTTQPDDLGYAIAHLNEEKQYNRREFATSDRP
jgi:hypothetical protein